MKRTQRKGKKEFESIKQNVIAKRKSFRKMREVIIRLVVFFLIWKMAGMSSDECENRDAALKTARRLWKS